MSVFSRERKFERIVRKFETQNPNLGPLCRVPIKSEMMAKWGDGDLLSFLEHNRAKVVLKLHKNFNTVGIYQPKKRPAYMSTYVGSELM